MSYPDPEVQYETAIANNTRRRGPLRFEEGIVTDTDVPNEFRRGAYGDTAGITSWADVTKTPGETMRERAHVGSSTWIEAPSLLSEFVQGAHVGDHEPAYEVEGNSGGLTRRQNRAVVND